MKLASFAAAAALAVGLHAAARADAIPPPAEINDLQKLLIGVWEEDACQYPEGLGHTCTARILSFGNEAFAELYTGSISYSNQYFTSANGGTWTAAQPDAKTIIVKVVKENGSSQELTLTLESDNAFVLKDSDASMLPASRFTRRGKPIESNK